MPNPFTIVSAELMDLDKLGREFVHDHTEHATLAAHAHTIIVGSRGSGKSMHLRFLEPAAQGSHLRLDQAGLIEYLRQPSAFLGVYVNCRDAALSRQEFRIAEHTAVDPARLTLLVSRYMAAVLIERICNTLLSQLGTLCETRALEAASVLHGLGVTDIIGRTIGDLLADVKERVNALIQLLNVELDACVLGGSAGVLESSPRLGMPLDVLEFVKFIQSVARIAAPIFLLFDEANELAKSQQQAVNSLMASRSQRTVCVKVATQRHGYSPTRVVGGPVEQVHDYVSLDLDSLYTSNQAAYYSRLKQIAEDRLARAGLVPDVLVYLPANPSDQALLAEARKIAGERYDALDEQSRPEDKANYIKKYAPAIVFQEVKSPKAGISYAGFDNLVHLSSGIVRAFIDCVSLMYARFVELHPAVQPHSIPIAVQNDVIVEYSNSFIEIELVERIETLLEGSPERVLLKRLHLLLMSFGALFRARLMDVESREPRIISISLKDTPPKDLADVLRFGEQMAYLHRRWYRSKRGNRNLPCYILNRRLCPFFNLDLSGFQGRLEIDSEELALAVTDSSQFVRAVFENRKRDRSEDFGQLALWEW